MNEKSIRKLSAIFFSVILTAALLVMFLFSLKHILIPQSFRGSVQKIENVTCKTGTEVRNIILPTKLNNLPPRTPVTLYAQLMPGFGKSILIKTVFAPLKVFADDELIFQCGQEGEYPPYMNDPPTIISTVKLPYKDEPVSLRIEYLSLTQRNVLSLPAIYMGSDVSLLNKLIYEDGFTLIFSLAVILMGLVMVLIRFTVFRNISAGSSFLWLGLFSLTAGLWAFGECDLSAFLLPYHSFLYTITYMGLFLLTIPFLNFGIIILNPKRKLLIRIMQYIHCISVASAVILQLSGIMDFSRSLYWFHIITPLAFVVFALYLLWEYIMYRSHGARQFVVPVVVLAVSTILELLNYYINTVYTFTVFFQLSFLVFIVSLGIISGNYVRRSFNAIAEKARLEYQVEAIERQLEMQRQQYAKITEHNDAIKAQRHDLRHHIAAIKGYCSSNNNEGLHLYLEKLLKDIPSDDGIIFCENFAVNAVASHYFSLARKFEINISEKLAIPAENGIVQDSDLCIIIGNLLENAIEACKKVTPGERFIRINSKMNYETLVIAMDNSFSEKLNTLGGIFLSTKREGEGMGLSSVIAISKKYGGEALFEAKDNVFLSSVYLNTESPTLSSPHPPSDL